MSTRKESVVGHNRPGNLANAHHGFANPRSTHNGYIPTGPTHRAGPPLSRLNHNQGDGGMASLTAAMGGLGMHQQFGHLPRNQARSGARSSSELDYHSGQTPGFYMPAHHQLMLNGNHFLPAQNQMHGGAGSSSGLYNPYQPYVQPTAYPNYNGQVSENAPAAQAWTPRLQVGTEMPTLITPSPRGSVSSNEVDLPTTPFNMYGGYTGVASADRTPSNGYAHSGAPSPLSQSFGISQLQKSINSAAAIPHGIQLLVQQDPPIPRAIPAPSSPLKPLDRSLENKNGETNVYIRGLLPETTDEMLYQWGVRFGDIQSSKSIIDMKTNLCKGFGFIKYYNYDEAGQCIRGFHYLGYEVSFARESFYSKLKKFSDDTNTNLYVSNIPKNLNEHELSAVFAPHKVCSSRILRDSQGNGRGVGFARFESRDVCEVVIKDFNNTPVSKPNGEEHLIQIRYSDTQEQKQLKQHTAAARQFRAAEFEYGVMQARNGGLLTSSQEHLLPLSAVEPDAANEFEQFMANNVGHNGASPYAATSVRATDGNGTSASTPVQRKDRVVSQTHSPVVDFEDEVSVSSDELNNDEMNSKPVRRFKTSQSDRPATPSSATRSVAE